ncbi:hypothetical protein NZD88_20950 [Chryseobacterium antibioticum]|uniref:Uncharacterized protein n=1 Tax=Chryseobacterium pyrolae TaxID=2987481 RepID=A0ABT2IPA7_9FLAO|nr:hypothetical protein [Chryseobacterium pyrolae]MCT2410032.1 hypothetical protein [Chryseobacterium pyrolae]
MEDNYKKPIKIDVFGKDLTTHPVGTGKPLTITDELLKKMSDSEKENLVKFFNPVRKKGKNK